MLNVICDSCKKPVKDALKDVNYVDILDKAVCSSCKGKCDDRVSQSMMSKRKYGFLDHKKVLSETLYKMCR
jgi:hypothetical protein